MNKDELKQYLKENLRISIDNVDIRYDGEYLEVKLLLDNEEISSDRISISRLQE